MLVLNTLEPPAMTGWHYVGEIIPNILPVLILGECKHKVFLFKGGQITEAVIVVVGESSYPLPTFSLITQPSGEVFIEIERRSRFDFRHSYVCIKKDG
jgi:hypothetical protein